MLESSNTAALLRHAAPGDEAAARAQLLSLDGDDMPGAVHMLHEGPRAPAAPLQEKVVPRHRAWIREVRVAAGSGEAPVEAEQQQMLEGNR